MAAENASFEQKTAVTLPFLLPFFSDKWLFVIN
jgi:hypothetical protein